MPWQIPGRGTQRYDDKGNYWGYIPSGFDPPCRCTATPSKTRINRNCPTGAIDCTSTVRIDRRCPTGSIDCTRQNTRTCPSGFTKVCSSRARWCSCRSNSTILI